MCCQGLFSCFFAYLETKTSFSFEAPSRGPNRGRSSCRPPASPLPRFPGLDRFPPFHLLPQMVDDVLGRRQQAAHLRQALAGEGAEPAGRAAEGMVAAPGLERSPTTPASGSLGGHHNPHHKPLQRFLVNLRRPRRCFMGSRASGRFLGRQAGSRPGATGWVLPPGGGGAVPGPVAPSQSARSSKLLERHPDGRPPAEPTAPPPPGLPQNAPSRAHAPTRRRRSATSVCRHFIACQRAPSCASRAIMQAFNPS